MGARSLNLKGSPNSVEKCGESISHAEKTRNERTLSSWRVADAAFKEGLAIETKRGWRHNRNIRGHYSCAICVPFGVSMGSPRTRLLSATSVDKCIILLLWTRRPLSCARAVKLAANANSQTMPESTFAVYIGGHEDRKGKHPSCM